MSKPRLWPWGAATTLLVALAPGPAMALEPQRAPSATPRVELRYDTSESLFLVGSSLYVATLFQFVLNPKVADECRWCDPPGFDRDAREALVSDDTASMHMAGNITAFTAAPASAFGLTGWAADHDGRFDEFWVNNLLIAEATSTTVALTQAVKPWVARQRPAVRFRQHEWESYGPAEKNASFFSGHSSFAFALAVSSGTISSMRGYRLAPLVWAVGLPIAAFTAYSRVAADAHYLSDVLVGTALGAAMGFSLPYFSHAPLARAGVVSWRPMLIPAAGGAQAGVGGFF